MFHWMRFQSPSFLVCRICLLGDKKNNVLAVKNGLDAIREQCLNWSLFENVVEIVFF